MQILKSVCRYSFSIFLYIFLLNFRLSFAKTISSDKLNNTLCSNSHRDINFDLKWVQDNSPPKGWYILLGNPVTRLHFAQLTQGRKIAQDEDLSKLCLKTVFDINDKEIGGVYQGYGNLRASRRCFKEPAEKYICEAVSTSNKNYSERFSAYVAYVDTRNFRSYHIAVFCFENGDIGWIINSLKRKLTSEDLLKIDNELRVMGFNPEEQVELHGESCEDQ